MKSMFMKKLDEAVKASRPHYRMTIIPEGETPHQFVWCAFFWKNFDDVILSHDKNAIGLRVR